MSLNKLLLIGRLGKDPQVNDKSNTKITRLSIATDSSYKDKKTGEKIQQTDWHNVVLFNKLAEIAEEYLSKGDQVYIEGMVKNRKYTAKDGTEKYTTEVIGSLLRMLGNKKKYSSDSEDDHNPWIDPSKSDSQQFSDDDIPF